MQKPSERDSQPRIRLLAHPWPSCHDAESWERPERQRDFSFDIFMISASWLSTAFDAQRYRFNPAVDRRAAGAKSARLFIPAQSSPSAAVCSLSRIILGRQHLLGRA